MYKTFTNVHAAAFSERWKKACDLDPSAGANGDRNINCRPCSATARERCPHSARVESGNPRGGDTGPRSRNAGQPMTGSRQVSPSGYVHRQIDSAKDERNLKPPLQTPKARRLFPLRRLFQRNKVRPLNTDGPSLTSEARPPCPNARVDSAHCCASFSNTNQRSGTEAVLGQSRKLTNINSDRTSRCPPEDGNGRPPSVVVGQTFVQTKSKSKRPWTRRLRSLFAPRSRGTKTTVQPFVAPQGQSEGPVTRPRSLKEDHNDPGHQSRYTSALTKNREAKGFGINASTKTMHSPQGSAVMATRPASNINQPFQIPGVPQFDRDHLQSSSTPAPRSDNPTLSQEQGKTSIIANHDDRELPSSTYRDASFYNSSVSTLPLSLRQEMAMEDNIAAVPNPDPLTSISGGDGKSCEIILASESSPMQDREGEGTTPDDNSVGKPVLQSPPTKRNDASFNFTMCSSRLLVHEEEDDDVQNGIESTLKSAAPCCTAADDESPTTSILMYSSQRLQAEVVKDGDEALYLEGSNSRQEPTSPSRNYAPSFPRTPISSRTSSRHHDESLTDENRIRDTGKPSTSIEVPFSTLTSLPTAISENMEALEGNGDELYDDEGPPLKQPSASSTSRSGLSISFQSSTTSSSPSQHALNRGNVESSKDLESSPSMAAKADFETAWDEPAKNAEKSDLDQHKATPAGCQESSLPKLSKKMSNESEHRVVVNKTSLCENQPMKINISMKSSSNDVPSTAPLDKKDTSGLEEVASAKDAEYSPCNSSSNDAATADNKSNKDNVSPSKNSQATQSDKNGVPELTAYPSIDYSELQFFLNEEGETAVVGSGNNGDIILMRRKGDTTLLAVKEVTRYVSFLKQEVAALHAVMDCPYFPKFVGVLDECTYAQELAGGVGPDAAYTFSMALYQYNRGLNTLDWLRACRDVTEGLRALHAAGWLHNDLHCGNVMVCPNPPGSEVAWCGKIIDLGNAKQISNKDISKLQDEEEQNMALKLAKQCAPEVLEGTSPFTEKSDIYSLGKLFVEVAGDAEIFRVLRLLGELSCMIQNPGARPTLEVISGILDNLIAEMTEAYQLPSSPSPNPSS